MGNIGIKITKPGSSVLSNEPLDYVAWSKYPELKIIRREQGSIAVASEDASNSVNSNHGLGYTPGFMGWFDYENNGNFFISGCAVGTLSNYSAKASSIRIDRDLITLVASRSDSGAGAFTMKYAYVLFDQTAEKSHQGNGKPIGYTSSDYGLKASKNNISAKNAAIYEQVINSNIETLKYHQTYNVQLNYDTSSNGEDSEEISHGLPYAPMAMAYLKGAAQTYWGPIPLGTIPQPFAEATIVTKEKIITEIIWAGSGSPSSGTVDFRIIVFKNRMII